MTTEPDVLPDLNPLKETLCSELPVNLLYEHDEANTPAFELEIVPQIEVALTRLRHLDAKRLASCPDTTYLFALHALEVATDLETLARRIGVPEHVSTALYYLGLVHDIGKLLLPPGLWETSAEKPSGLFKALRRTHGALGAAFISADPRFLEAPYIEEGVLPFLKGEKPLLQIVPRDLVSKLPNTLDFEVLGKTITSSSFGTSKSAFIPLAVTACLRHHEKTGTDGPQDQPLWLKFLALLEDLSGNMVERPHFAAAGRKTALVDAVHHMCEEGEKAHDLSLLKFIKQTKIENPAPGPRPDTPLLPA